MSFFVDTHKWTALNRSRGRVDMCVWGELGHRGEIGEGMGRKETTFEVENK